MADLSNPVEVDDDHEKLINNIKRRTEGSNEKLSNTLLASSVAALATFGFGYNLGFPSPVEASLSKGNFLNSEEFSWFNVCVLYYNFYFLFSYYCEEQKNLNI